MAVTRFDNDELRRASSPEGQEAQLRVASKLVGRGLFNEVSVEMPDGDIALVAESRPAARPTPPARPGVRQ